MACFEKYVLFVFGITFRRVTLPNLVLNFSGNFFLVNFFIGYHLSKSYLVILKDRVIVVDNFLCEQKTRFKLTKN